MSARTRSDRIPRPPDSGLQAGRATPPEESGTVGQFARGPVLSIAGAVMLALSIASGFSGYFTDELYFLIAGKEHLGWGYADQPPLVPLLARAMDAVFPGSVIALRLPATLATAAGVVVTALIARELGGRRRAQVLAAGAYAVSVQVGLHGLTLGTWTIDPVWWTVITWLLVRWARLRNKGHHEDRLLLWAGVVTAISLQTKFLIPVFWAMLALSVSVVGPRDLLRRPLLYVGGALAVLTTLPGLFWQAHHGWPQLGMVQSIAEGADSRWGRLGFLPLVVIHAGIPVGVVFCCLGLWRLLRSPELRPYRFLGWTIMGVLTVFLLAGGRLRYSAGLYALLFATAAVDIQRRRPAAWWRWVPTWPVYTISALVTAAVLVFSVQSKIPRRNAWPQLAGEVASAYHSCHHRSNVRPWCWPRAARWLLPSTITGPPMGCPAPTARKAAAGISVRRRLA
ncbi:MAG: ArnT family glycosyltransferase [Egibacteraceae bacterium]